MESNEEMKSIKITERNSILKFGLIDENNNPTGEYLEFDTEDIEIPIRLNESIERHKKNLRWLKTAIDLVEKEPNYTGKKLLTSHQEKELRIINDFYKKEMEAFDYAFGKDTSKKLLNGRKPYFTMFDDFTKMLEPVMNQIGMGYKKVKEKIVEKYSNINKGDDVIE